MNFDLHLFLQAVRGPIILILMGILVLLNQSGRLSISQSWPILVIAYGFMKLLERMVARPIAPPVPPGGLQ